VPVTDVADDSRRENADIAAAGQLVLRDSSRGRGVERELAVRTPKHAFEEGNAAARSKNSTLTNACAERRRSQEAALDLESGKPKTQLGERCERNTNVDHCNAEPALDVTEVVAKRWLRLEAYLDDTLFEVGLEKLKRRELSADRCRLIGKQRAEFFDGAQSCSIGDLDA